MKCSKCDSTNLNIRKPFFHEGTIYVSRIFCIDCKNKEFDTIEIDENQCLRCKSKAKSKNIGLYSPYLCTTCYNDSIKKGEIQHD